MPALKYLAGYPPSLQQRVQELIAQNLLGKHLQQRYPDRHEVRNDKALYSYVQSLKQTFLRNAPAIDKVLYDSRLDVVRKALGMHTAISRAHGGRLRATKEIRVATVFREAPSDFLRMIVVHELAHLKEADHNKAFYQLCTHMEPDYHQLEFDLRAWLCWREAVAAPAATD